MDFICHLHNKRQTMGTTVKCEMGMNGFVIWFTRFVVHLEFKWFQFCNCFSIVEFVNSRKFSMRIDAMRSPSTKSDIIVFDFRFRHSDLKSQPFWYWVLHCVEWRYGNNISLHFIDEILLTFTMLSTIFHFDSFHTLLENRQEYSELFLSFEEIFFFFLANKLAERFINKSKKSDSYQPVNHRSTIVALRRSLCRYKNQRFCLLKFDRSVNDLPEIFRRSNDDNSWFNHSVSSWTCLFRKMTQLLLVDYHQINIMKKMKNKTIFGSSLSFRVFRRCSFLLKLSIVVVICMMIFEGAALLIDSSVVESHDDKYLNLNIFTILFTVASSKNGKKAIRIRE